MCKRLIERPFLDPKHVQHEAVHWHGRGQSAFEESPQGCRWAGSRSWSGLSPLTFFDRSSLNHDASLKRLHHPLFLFSLKPTPQQRFIALNCYNIIISATRATNKHWRGSSKKNVKATMQFGSIWGHKCPLDMFQEQKTQTNKLMQQLSATRMSLLAPADWEVKAFKCWCNIWESGLIFRTNPHFNTWWVSSSANKRNFTKVSLFPDFPRFFTSTSTMWSRPLRSSVCPPRSLQM